MRLSRDTTGRGLIKSRDDIITSAAAACSLLQYYFRALVLEILTTKVESKIHLG